MTRQLTISSKVSIICAPHWHIRLTFTSGRQRATLTLETPVEPNLVGITSKQISKHGGWFFV
jgi:hypothetical protein